MLYTPKTLRVFFFHCLTSLSARLLHKLTGSSTSLYQLNYLETAGEGTVFPVKGVTGTVAVWRRNDRIRLTIRVEGQALTHPSILLYSRRLTQDLLGLYATSDAPVLIGVLDGCFLQIETTGPTAEGPLILRATRTGMISEVD